MQQCKYVQLLAVCALLVCIPLVGEADARTRLIASLQGPIETAYGQAYQRFDQCVKEKTKGELFLETYPNAQLGGLTEAFEQVRQGAVDVTAVAPGIMAEFVPEIQVFVIPFVFKSIDNWRAVVSGPVGDKIASTVQQKAGVRVIGYFGGAVRQVVSKRPINSLADMKGLVMRLLPGDVLQTAWSSVGAVPSTVAYNEVYNALQLGVIQGLDNEPEWIFRMKFYEQAPNIALTSHEIVTRLMLFSEKRYQALPKDHQAVVTECGKSSSQFERELEIKLDQEMLDTMITKHNVKTTKIDQEAFKRTVGAAVAPLVQKYGLTDLVKEIEAAR
jgi:tripartite ATP-independent transporter DctP family solute receptor